MNETHEENASIGSSLLIFLLGVAVGATVAILYAPSSGAETRAHLVEGADKLKDKAGELREKASHITSQVVERAEGIKENVVTRLRRADGEPKPELAGESVSPGDANSDGKMGAATS